MTGFDANTVAQATYFLLLLLLVGGFLVRGRARWDRRGWQALGLWLLALALVGLAYHLLTGR